LHLHTDDPGDMSGEEQPVVADLQRLEHRSQRREHLRAYLVSSTIRNDSSPHWVITISDYDTTAVAGRKGASATIVVTIGGGSRGRPGYRRTDRSAPRLRCGTRSSCTRPSGW